MSTAQSLADTTPQRSKLRATLARLWSVDREDGRALADADKEDLSRLRQRLSFSMDEPCREHEFQCF